MAKSSVLTPVLAGVLGVAVVGSGIAYYNVYVKDSTKDSDTKEESKKSNSAVLSIDQAAENIEKQIGKAQQIAKGELDGGYKGTITYTPPADGEIGELGIKNVTLGVEAKQKDKMSGVDYTIGYDSKDILTINMVVDNDGETAYVKIPELSDAYLYGTVDEIEDFLGDSLGGSAYNAYSSASPSYDSDYGDFTFEESAYRSADAMAISSVSSTPDLKALENIDFTALFEDLATYADTVQENAPAPTDADDYTVSSGDYSITLTTKRYIITANDAANVVKAVAEKGKADEMLKNAFTTMGMTADQYDELWSSLETSVDTVEESDETVTLDIYYNGDEIQGINAVPSDDSDEKIYMVWASDAEKMIVDCNTVMDGETLTASGLITAVDNTLNGSVTMTNSSSYSSFEMTVTFDGLTASDDTLNGGFSVSGKQDDDSFSVNFTFDCKGDDSDITISGDYAGNSIGTVNLKTQQTDASDITVPTGTGYKLTDEQELQKYAESCDIVGWMNTLKDTLGEETYNALFGSAMGSSSQSYDDYSDYSWDDDDYDWGFDDSSDSEMVYGEWELYDGATTDIDA